MPDRMAQYASMSRDDLLREIATLLAERDDYSSQVFKLNMDVTTARITGWNNGYYWGYRDCARDTIRKPVDGK